MGEQRGSKALRNVYLCGANMAAVCALHLCIALIWVGELRGRAERAYRRGGQTNIDRSTRNWQQGSVGHRHGLVVHPFPLMLMMQNAYLPHPHRIWREHVPVPGQPSPGAAAGTGGSAGRGRTAGPALPASNRCNGTLGGPVRVLHVCRSPNQLSDPPRVRRTRHSSAVSFCAVLGTRLTCSDCLIETLRRTCRDLAPFSQEPTPHHVADRPLPGQRPRGPSRWGAGSQQPQRHTVRQPPGAAKHGGKRHGCRGFRSRALGYGRWAAAGRQPGGGALWFRGGKLAAAGAG